VHQFENRIAELETEKLSRRDAIDGMCEEVRGIWSEIGRSPSTEYEGAVSSGAEAVGFTEETMSALEAFLEALRTEKAEREERIRTIGEEITVLWEKLETPEGEQTKFLESHNGIGDDVIEAVSKYLHAKQAEFQRRLAELVSGLRERIAALWEELRFSEETTAEFSAFQIKKLDEACWEAHKEYLSELEGKAESMRPILSIVVKREAILADKDEYQKIISDPSRLTSRRGGAARLHEEKLERRIKRDLPKATAKLCSMVQQWETDNDQHFVLNGERILDSLQEQVEESKVPSRVSISHRPSMAPAVASGRSTSRASVDSRSSVSSADTSALPKPQAAQPPVARRKPLAKSSGAANIAAKSKVDSRRTKRKVLPPKVDTSENALHDEEEAAATLPTMTPSAVKVAPEARAAASAIASALAADV
jgi:hypothetical protein